jgi:ATP-dependent Clp protease ATP-binding subunit ClpA
LFENVPVSIKYNQVYQIDIASVLTKVPENQIDYTIQRLCIEAHSAKNIILYFDNAGSFFGLNGGPDLTNIILPIIEAGGVRMIFSFNTNQWQIIQKTKPAIVSVLNYQAVSATDQKDTLKILENQTLFTEHENDCTFTYEGIKEVYRLADKYGPDIAMPEKAISILEDVARNNQGGLISKHEAQVTLEKITGIKIATVTNNEKQTLLSLEDELHKRVIGQNNAIKQIASALKRSRTGVANQNKPIGTFLFLGPTGVGKTEVSKTLANVYFGGSNAGMVRLDMNEYITQDSVHRLLSSTTEHGSSFLESIKKKPFSVVLFDEIEKAHPDIVNVFLQLLDEGVIKDNDNKTISFKDSIIIATSNAGSELIRSSISSGVEIDTIQESIANELISSGVFKPEFINRFDSVIVFAPLKPEELKKIVEVLLGDLNSQLANQGITVKLTPEAVAWLSNKGYDERLGARP